MSEMEFKKVLINDLISGWESFVNMDKPTVEYPLGFEPEASTKDGLIPSTWVENGVRHVMVWDKDLDHQRIELVNGEWKLMSEPPF